MCVGVGVGVVVGVGVGVGVNLSAYLLLSLLLLFNGLCITGMFQKLHIYEYCYDQSLFYLFTSTCHS